MACEVEYTDEFGIWWTGLSEAEQVDVAATVTLLEVRDVRLGFPHSSGIKGSRHSHMRELRVQSGGKPIRVFYAFDPVRNAILLIGATRPVMAGFTKCSCRWPTIFTISTLRN